MAGKKRSIHELSRGVQIVLPHPQCSPTPNYLSQELRPCLCLISLNSCPQFLSSSPLGGCPCRGLGKRFRVEKAPLPIVRAESAELLSLRQSTENEDKGDIEARWAGGQLKIVRGQKIRRFSGPRVKDTRGSVTFYSLQHQDLSLKAMSLTFQVIDLFNKWC